MIIPQSIIPETPNVIAIYNQLNAIRQRQTLILSIGTKISQLSERMIFSIPTIGIVRKHLELE